MNSHELFYFPYASLTNSQLPLLRVAALYFDKLIILDPVGASWATVGANHIARDPVRTALGHRHSGDRDAGHWAKGARVELFPRRSTRRNSRV